MVETVFHGPVVSLGAADTSAVNPWDGPSLFYQAEMVLDPRFAPANKDGEAPGRIKGWLNSPEFVSVDTTPSANNTALVAAAQTPSTTAGIALALVTAQAGTAAGVPVFAPGIPIVPLGTSAATTVSAIDFGFATGTTAANSTTVVVDDNSKFTLGQWIVVAGAGAAGVTNRALFTQVQSISTNTTVITITPAALTALNNTPIGQGNLYNLGLPPATQFGPSAASAFAAEPYKVAGLGLAFDPLQGVTRALCISAASIGSGTGTFLASGYDIYNVPMSELLTANGTNVVNGKKAFKYVNTITVVTAATTVTPAQVQIGVSDVFGLNFRSDKWEYLTIAFNGGLAATTAGWTAALATTSSTTTVDVRGTVNASTFGGSTVASTNGARRLTIIQQVPLNNMINATPLSTSALFGTAQI